LEARLADSDVGAGNLVAARQRPRVEVPQPGFELLRRGSPHLDVDAAQARGDRGFPNARVRQIREDPQLAHDASFICVPPKKARRSFPKNTSSATMNAWRSPVPGRVLAAVSATRYVLITVVI